MSIRDKGGINLLKVQNIEKYYGSKNNVTKALDRLSFDVADGEFIAIMGASGSGKTTLLNCVSTIDTVSAGKIILDGVNVTEISEKNLAKFRRERLGFVFQEFNLLDTLTIEENIGVSLTISHADPNQVQSRVRKVAEQLGITDVLDKFPYQVSGGQKQRAACARAIVNNQSLILADEPTGALDSKASKNLLEIMSRMNQELSATILMVTHDAYSASYASRILFLKDGALFNELRKADKSRSALYHEILDVLALLGGDVSDVI
jgi:putative ABC transport system ATP-binding protein